MTLKRGENHISDEGALFLLKCIKKHAGINNLLIDFSEYHSILTILIFLRGQNCVTDDTIKLLSEVLVGFPKLDMLFINVCCGHNSITDDGVNCLGEALQHLSQLTNLRLNFCGFL